jgi:hypothetical protein
LFCFKLELPLLWKPNLNSGEQRPTPSRLAQCAKLPLPLSVSAYSLRSCSANVAFRRVFRPWERSVFLFYADRKPNLTKNLKKVARVASKLTQRHKDSVVSDITGCD